MATEGFSISSRAVSPGQARDLGLIGEEECLGRVEHRLRDGQGDLAGLAGLAGHQTKLQLAATTLDDP